MYKFFEPFFASALFWKIPAVILGLLFVLAVCLYFRRQSSGELLFKKRLKVLVLVTLGARVFYAVFLSFSQYLVWSSNKIYKVFLNSSADGKSGIVWGPFAKFFQDNPHGYFWLYVVGRFWINAVLSILVAYVFYLFLRALKKYKERFFEEGELGFGWALALIVGWPGFVIFLPLVFVFVLLISIFRMLFMKRKYTTMGLPFLFAAIPALPLGVQIIDLLGWGAIKI